MKPLPNRPAASVSAAVPEHPRQRLSAAVDGDEQALDGACSLWRDDEEARRDWHAWHLIGDVMRSDDLASAPARDAEFLAGVRARLAAEPVVLAPQPSLVPSRRRHQPWLVPAAAAAGFAVVAGVLLAGRLGTPGAPDAAVLAGAASAARGTQLVSAPVRTQGVPAVARGDIYIRDVRLDEFLRVHQHARGGVAMSTQREGLRNVEAAGAIAAPVSR